MIDCFFAEKHNPLFLLHFSKILFRFLSATFLQNM